MSDPNYSHATLVHKHLPFNPQAGSSWAMDDATGPEVVSVPEGAVLITLPSTGAVVVHGVAVEVDGATVIGDLVLLPLNDWLRLIRNDQPGVV